MGAQQGNAPGSSARVLGAGDGSGRQLEGLEEGTLTVGAERGGQGPGGRLWEPTQGRCSPSRKIDRPGIAACGPGDRRCKARPLAGICSGCEEMGLAGVWEGSEGEETYHYLPRQASVGFRARKGHLRPTVITVAASLSPPPQSSVREPLPQA